MTDSFAPSEARIEAHLKMGQHWLGTGIPLRAIESFRAALAENPNHGLAHALLASALSRHATEGYGVTPAIKASTLEEALVHANTAIGLEANEVLGYVARADVLCKQDKWDMACADFEAALQITPDDADLHLAFGGALFHQRRYIPAEAAARHACALDPLNPGAFMLLCKLHSFFNRPREAREAAETAVRLSPNDSYIHELLGDLCYDEGLLPEARRSLLEALRLDPANATAGSSLSLVKAASAWWQKPYWVYTARRRHWPSWLQGGVDVFMIGVVFAPLYAGWRLMRRPAYWDSLTGVPRPVWYGIAVFWAVCFYWALVQGTNNGKLDKLQNPDKAKPKDPLAVQVAAVIFALFALWLAWTMSR